MDILQGEKANNLCQELSFQLFRLDNIVLSLIFGGLFCMIKRRSDEFPQQTESDKLNYSIQQNTLKRLGIAISWFLLVSLLESFTDWISKINAVNGQDCLTSLFAD